MKEEFYIPGDNGDIRLHSYISFALYNRLVNEDGMHRERARSVLPVNLYKTFWFTVNARSLMNFLALRNDDHAQWEIQAYAKALEAIFAEIMPVTHKSFIDNGRKAP